MTGQTISHYRILEKLGEGGMGVVYKAEDTKLRRQVALKFLAPHLADDEEVRRRFLHEAQAAAALSHPNICVVHEVDEDHNFLGLEYVEGETVAAKIKRRPLPLEEALDIAIQAAQGLEAAHEKRIVHRDVKSANLMVTPAGQVKVMDFGLAQLRGHSQITRTGSRLGTPAYMSPEQFRGEAVDHTHRHLVTGRCSLRNDGRYAALHGRQRSGNSILRDEPGARALERPASRRVRRYGSRLEEGAGQGPKPALPAHRGSSRGPEGVAEAWNSNAGPGPQACRKKAVAAALLVAAALRQPAFGTGGSASARGGRKRFRKPWNSTMPASLSRLTSWRSGSTWKCQPTQERSDCGTRWVVFFSLSTDPRWADVSIREMGEADGNGFPSARPRS